MSPKRLAIFGLMGAAIGAGILGAGFEHLGGYARIAIQIAFIIIFTTFVFLWIHHDSRELHFSRSRLLNAGLLLLPLLFVPIYLLLSRPKGLRLTALLKCFSFFFVLIVTTGVIEFVVRLSFFLYEN